MPISPNVTNLPPQKPAQHRKSNHATSPEPRTPRGTLARTDSQPNASAPGGAPSAATSIRLPPTASPHSTPSATRSPGNPGYRHCPPSADTNSRHPREWTHLPSRQTTSRSFSADKIGYNAYRADLRRSGGLRLRAIGATGVVFVLVLVTCGGNPTYGETQVVLSLDPPANCGGLVSGPIRARGVFRGEAGRGCPAARLFCGVSGFLARGRVRGAVEGRSRCGPDRGWSGRCGGRPAAGEQVQPFVLVFAGGVHRGLAGEGVHDIACSASPGLAPSASLSRVQTFMLMTTPMISRISSCEKCSASAS